MPLLIQNRPPSPFFNQQRRRNLPANTVRDSAHTDKGTDALRLYPLESVPSSAMGERNARPVRPLTHPQSGQRRSNQAANPHLGQPGFSMAAPISPTHPQSQMSQPHNMARPHMSQPHMSQALTQQSHMPVKSAMPQSGSISSESNQQPQPPSPELAARQFKRVNQGLPDGVRYEPLDENTMRLLRDNGHLPAMPSAASPPQVSQSAYPAVEQSHANLPPQTHQSAHQSAVSQPTDTLSSNMQEVHDMLISLIQDEHNAHVFYGHFSENISKHDLKSALSDISNDSKWNAKMLSNILTTQMKSNFQPVDAAINTGLELNDALELALREENNSLRALAKLMDIANDIECEKVIQRVINKKFVNTNLLLRLRHFYTENS